MFKRSTPPIDIEALRKLTKSERVYKMLEMYDKTKKIFRISPKNREHARMIAFALSQKLG